MQRARVLSRRICACCAAVLEGAGHLWMCQQLKQGADTINAFVASLG